ncbi:o-succinylbenzoate--CoA ligase [Mycolicibacterium vaccae]|uniref:O-succinylbenzoic acid--CoA ligase n=3 Tax=Mycolicibacterium vaccae TaxID=1810 RepID=K0V974_MYCVA|nr:o-succinylbenzoate--CoA ligase [Mycolicibacterium vaccae]ANI37981.1 O-succinylbenzoic acid--CoA ligase [Mycolicibacterium vaccae 95051]EJZ07624.1 O-succinylbenzoic acid--CoA ligase [Mycolicibacterium vaccae ATCC 25954]MCV7060391.1 o-succinylbenzoate--CoA ligase [Mycolicibacterium vaccae]
MIRDVLAGRASILPVPAGDPAQADLLATAMRAGQPVGDSVAAVLSTSGTTGTPKGAMLTVSALTASAEATHARLGGPGRWLLALPTYHVAGFQVLVRSAIAGTAPVTVPPSFTAPELVSAVEAMGSGRRYTSLVAAQLDKALRDPHATRALADLDAVLIGGGPMPAGVAERASAAGISVVRTYGMSETAGGCVYDGIPLDGVAVRVDGDGRIWLGGPTVAAGYRNPVTPDPFAEPGWFRTDDLGAVHDSGRLQVLGRVDDAISTGGLKVLPGIVEAAVATHPAVADCAVFGVPDERLGQRVVVAVVTTPGSSITLEQLRSHVAATLPSTAAPRQLHIVEELPLRGIGKVDRRALANRFA